MMNFLFFENYDQKSQKNHFLAKIPLFWAKNAKIFKNKLLKQVKNWWPSPLVYAHAISNVLCPVVCVHITICSRPVLLWCACACTSLSVQGLCFWNSRNISFSSKKPLDRAVVHSSKSKDQPLALVHKHWCHQVCMCFFKSKYFDTCKSFSQLIYVGKHMMMKTKIQTYFLVLPFFIQFFPLLNYKTCTWYILYSMMLHIKVAIHYTKFISLFFLALTEYIPIIIKITIFRFQSRAFSYTCLSGGGGAVHFTYCRPTYLKSGKEMIFREMFKSCFISWLFCAFICFLFAIENEAGRHVVYMKSHIPCACIYINYVKFYASYGWQASMAWHLGGTAPK